MRKYTAEKAIIEKLLSPQVMMMMMPLMPAPAAAEMRARIKPFCAVV